VRETSTGRVQQLTRTHAAEIDPFFMVGDDRVAYHRDDALFIRELATGLESQPAVVRFEKDPAEEPDEDYLRDQQRRLVDYVRRQKRERDSARERDLESRELDGSRVPAPFYLGDDVELKASSLSPSGRWLLLLLLPKDRDDGKHDMMPNYVTDSAYVSPEQVRPLVGTGARVSDQVVVLDLKRHERADISLESLPGIHEDPLAAIREPDVGDEGDENGNGNGNEEETKARAVYVGSSAFGESARAGILWSADGERLVLNVFSHDHKDRWIAEVDLTAGSLKPLERISDEAWINWSLNEIAFLESEPTLYYTTEESGYSQLYLRSLSSEAATRLTDGEFVVSDVVESPDGRYLYYTANVDHPGIYEIYRYDLQGQRNEQLTRLGGRNSFVLSPEGKSLLVTHSETAMPPELYVQNALPGADARRVTDTVSSLFQSFSWVEPEIVPIPSTHHDRPIYSRLYRPADEAAGPRAAVVFVHGAGYLQNAHFGWSSYFREFMFHTLLAQKGYVVVDMDYRASAGYGRDWRTAIYRQMGTPELEDLKDGVRYLAANENVDPARVGVYGGSYGGFITFMALFKEPDLFACGAALRPVTDWAHYNHPYTARILNTPTEDPEAYERSSPIEFAEGLSKPLLIAHGMLDDNVFFKDSVRLVQRLIELEKTGWESAIYPVEAHGFREPSSWLDEYRRIDELFETNLSGGSAAR
jgi:dipeptidyl aminopeptidase/acylaminoacyl peptidase